MDYFALDWISEREKAAQSLSQAVDQAWQGIFICLGVSVCDITTPRTRHVRMSKQASKDGNGVSKEST